MAVGRFAALLIGLAAGLGIALKPHFVLFWLAVECYLRRVRPESVAVVLVGLAYLAAVPLIAPEYFEVVRGMGGPYYDYLSNSLLVTALLGDGAPIPLVACLAYVAMRHTSRHPRLWTLLLVATVALYLSAVLQHKGWRYHYYPSMATGLLLLGCILADARRPLQAPLERVYAAVAASVTGGLAVWTVLACLLQAADPLNPRYDADPDIGRLLPLVREQSAGGKVMVLSWSMASSFPLLTDAGVEPASRFNAIWMLAAEYRERLRSPEPLRYRSRAEMSSLERYMNDAVIEDFRRHRPTLVLGLRPAPDLPEWGLRRLDHVGYFTRDSSFARLFADYAFMGEVGQYVVYRRR
jgi:hypothetical protein